MIGAYDRGVDAYESLWSPIILPPAVAVVEALDLRPTARVADVGGGAGALLPAIRAHATAGAAFALDASHEMLRAAVEQRAAVAVQTDALALPLADRSVDAVVLAYVLFHLSDPGGALREAMRVLVPGGGVGTVTWAREAGLAASSTFDEVLTEAGAPPAPLRRVDSGLDSADAVATTLESAGLEPASVWVIPLEHDWDPDAFWALATGSGVNRTRLAALDAAARERALVAAHARLEGLPPEAFQWSGEVVCAVSRVVT